MGDKFAPNDKVFAKLKGFQPWPARVIERINGTGKDEKYRIEFYGSHDESNVKVDQMYKFNEETKAKYGKPTRKATFNEAMAEIMAAIEDETSEEVPPPERVENDTTEPLAMPEEETAKELPPPPESADGDLMIDEGPPALPPVLKKEAPAKEVASTPTPGKAKRPRTLSKRDSVNTTPVTTPSTPVVATPEAGGTEIVSRSGRKIKPKRFADDEISPMGKLPGKIGSEDGQPAAKRAKRGSVSSRNVKVPEEQGCALEVVEGETTALKIKPTSGVKIKTELPEENGGPPMLRAAAPKRSTSTGQKQLPALEPSVGTRRSERKVKSEPMKEEEPTKETQEEEDEMEVDKENSKEEEEPEEFPNENNTIISAEEHDEKKFMPVVTKAPSSVPEKIQRVEGKNGVKLELSYDAKNPEGKTDADHKKWLAIASQNIQKVTEDLADEVESQGLINSIADTVSCEEEDAKSRDKLAAKLRLLRLEGEVIEIIGEIVGCLAIDNAECTRAIDLLDRLNQHKLNRLMLKKHPEVVQTIDQLRKYVGNLEEWAMSDQEKTEFSVAAQTVRSKASSIFEHFQEIFDVDSPETFMKAFEQEVKEFKASVEDLPLSKVLGLTEDNGKLQELELEVELSGDGDIEGESQEDLSADFDNENEGQDEAEAEGETDLEGQAVPSIEAAEEGEFDPPHADDGQ